MVPATTEITIAIRNAIIQKRENAMGTLQREMLTMIRYLSEMTIA